MPESRKQKLDKLLQEHKCYQAEKMKKFKPKADEFQTLSETDDDSGIVS